MRVRSSAVVLAVLVPIPALAALVVKLFQPPPAEVQAGGFVSALSPG
jgi:hypothetical protein